ncbi:hypothetical protein [Pedobacter sandarakinus]|uniref:hypothetical protein n=1 Tax=Pedobacter sandarakinus TaxID=353156 RepID=UPI0022460FB1|nr:hypothetical protein [Pedobacter sandarakinus]MCX2574001.1 hypothetical protein [Pedobacter sandarakinus]
MNSTETKMGMLGGISFSVLGLSASDFAQATLLAGIGACVSFFVSKLLQWFHNRE